MTTILVKNVSERLERDLRKLKAELGCRTWADLLARLVESERSRGQTVGLTEERLGEMRVGVQGLLRLRGVVSSKWKGRPSVLEEVRRSRRHDDY